MKKRIPEHWLSAYVDGELDARRSAIVARLSAKHPAIERRIDELRRVSAAVASLPKSKLAGDARLEVWANVLKHPDLLAAEESAVSACLDGELSPTQSELVEKRTTNGALKIANQYLEIGDALRDLPSYAAPAGAISSALAQIKLEVKEGAEVAAELRELPRVSAPADVLEQAIAELQPLHPPPVKVFRWRREGWATGVAAALLTGVGLFFYQSAPNQQPPIADASAEQPRPIIEVAEKAVEPPKNPVKPTPTPPKNETKSLKGLVADHSDDIIDDRWLPESKIQAVKHDLPKDLPKSLLELARPGREFELPGKRITFLCLDVKKMSDRLEIVLLNTTVDRKSLGSVGGKEGDIVSVEIEATPSQFSEMLSKFKQHDERERQIAEVEVREPEPEPKPMLAAKVEGGLKAGPALANVPSKQDAGAKPPAVDKPEPPKETPAVTLPPDAPRKYLVVFRRQQPAVESKKKW
jgi:anti-sigma factor RsiW